MCQQYYAHSQNQFWRLIGEAIGVDFTGANYNYKLDLLQNRHIALWDVVATAVRSGSLDTSLRQVAGNDLQQLLAKMPQLRAIAFNGAAAARMGRQAGLPADIEHPDRMIFDLDPDEGLDFEDVKTAAVILKDELATLGLASDAMLSGGKGIHVVIALDGSAEWEQVKDFASRFARAMAGAKPELFTANIRKAERKGRIFIDWLRNQRGSTAVQP